MSRVYVGRLPFEARERDVERFFKGYGNLVDIIVKRGFAFVEFRDRRDADDAVHDLNGRSLMGMRYDCSPVRLAGPNRSLSA